MKIKIERDLVGYSITVLMKGVKDRRFGFRTSLEVYAFLVGARATGCKYEILLNEEIIELDNL
jgi:hypothetical protein